MSKFTGISFHATLILDIKLELETSTDHVLLKYHIPVV